MKMPISANVHTKVNHDFDGDNTKPTPLSFELKSATDNITNSNAKTSNTGAHTLQSSSSPTSSSLALQQRSA